MARDNFFEKQTILTAAKTKIYKDYITGYLPKLLMSFGRCFIADLFCGPGKNGGNSGSPLILIDRIKYILSSPKINQRSYLKIDILFNDQESENIKNLKEELSKIDYDKNIINIEVKNEKYENLLPKIIKNTELYRTPKFFFLDPFKYSNVKMTDLQELMLLPNTEVLLFVPVFLSYRFTSANFNEDHKTRKFNEEFTIKGMADYKSIHPYLTSIKSKLIQQIKLGQIDNKPYVRYILLDGGTSKNSLFLITGHMKAMLLMNKIAFKNTHDGSCNKINLDNQNTLFPTNEYTQFYSLFKNKLIDYIQENMRVSNYNLIEYTIREGFLPKDTKYILKELTESKKVSIFTPNNEIIYDNRKWAISDNPTKDTVIKWTEDEKDENRMG